MTWMKNLLGKVADEIGKLTGAHKEEVPAAAPTAPRAQQPSPPQQELIAYADSLRPGLRSLLPGNPISQEGQQQMLRAIGTVSDVFNMAANMAQSQLHRCQDSDDRMIVAVHTGQLCRLLEVINLDAVAADVAAAADQVLLPALAALDFYVHVVTPQHRQNVEKLYMLILAQLHGRGVKIVESPAGAGVKPSRLQQMWQRAKNAPEDGREAALDALAGELLQAETLWLLCDDIIGQTHPLTDAQGRLFVCTDERAAKDLTDFLRQQGLCTGKPGKYTRSELPAMFQKLRDAGHVYVKVLQDDEGAVEVPLDKLAPTLTGGVLSRRNAPLRMMLLREMTYLVHLQRMTDPALKAQHEESLASMGLTMRCNAWRFLGNTVLWVIASPLARDGKAWTTAGAMKAMETEDAAFFSEPAAPEGCLYTGLLQLQTIKRGNQQHDEGFVLAFTSWLEADETLSRFAQMGMKGGIVAATWSEIAGQAQEVAGVMIDYVNLRYILGKEQFPEVAKSAASQAGFIVNIRTGEKPEKPAQTAEEADLPRLWKRAHDATGDARNAALQALAKALVQAEELYVIEEEIGSRQWPCVDEEGRTYAALNQAEAERLARQLQAACRTRCIPVADRAAGMLQAARDMGQTRLRIQHDGEVVDLPLELCVPELSGGLVSQRNATLRWLLLQTTAYFSRMRRLMEDESEAESIAQLQRLAEESRRKALQHPEALVLWVLTPAMPGAVLTQLTPEAIDVMKASNRQLAEGGSRGVSVFTAPLGLQSVTDADGNTKLVMAFSNWSEAQRMLEKSGQPGTIVGAVFREIVAQMDADCNLLIDFFGLGFVLYREDFPLLAD